MVMRSCRLAMVWVNPLVAVVDAVAIRPLCESARMTKQKRSNKR
jgi:hypothetical protein